jgi:hypothetical protein
VEDPKFPSESTEAIANFVGFGINVGDAMTYKLLTQDTRKIIYRSVVRLAEATQTRNLRLFGSGEKETLETLDQAFIQSKLLMVVIPSRRYQDSTLQTLLDVLTSTFLKKTDRDIVVVLPRQLMNTRMIWKSIQIKSSFLLASITISMKKFSPTMRSLNEFNGISKKKMILTINSSSLKKLPDTKDLSLPKVRITRGASTMY